MRIRRKTSAVLVAVMLGAVALPSGAAADAPLAQPIEPACADAPEGRFADTTGVHQAGVDCIGWWGVTQGDGQGAFSPGQLVSRDQMATFMARVIELSGGELPVEPAATFEDVSGTHALAINQLAALEVVGGTSATTFNPTGTVNRAQMAAFLARAYEARTGEALPLGDITFPDIEGNVHAENIVRIATAGLTGGTADGRYDPGAPVSRAQMGTFLARLLALLVDSGTTAYPPANPVPMPEPTPPVDGDVTEMDRHNDPLILSTEQVSVEPGQSEIYTTPLASQHADVMAWFYDGPATADDINDRCTPLGREGISMAMDVVPPGQEIGEAFRTEFSAKECGFGVRSLDPWMDSFPSDAVQAQIRNDSDSTLTRQLHFGQRGAFETAEHPRGATKTYAFDNTSWANTDALGHTHPTTAWAFSVEVSEPSTLTLSKTPMTFGWDVPTCPESLSLMVFRTDTGQSDFADLPLLDAGEMCAFEFDVEGPAFVFDNMFTDARLEVTVTPSN